MRSVLDLAIVGAGSMGMNHVRVAMGLRDVRVAFVVDPNPERGQAAAERAGGSYLRSVGDVIGNVDAAVVAVPTGQHLSVGLQLLEAGVHTLIEKPLADTSGDAQRLADAAEASGSLLMVGHIERFNPAVLALPSFLADPILFEIARVSPFTTRVSESVIMDLMIHDLDIIRSLNPATVASVSASGRAVRSQVEDLAVAMLTFANGTMSTLTASRLGQEKIRTITITQLEDVIKVDLIRQEITIHSRQEISFYGDGQGYRSSGITETPFISNRSEPLQLELEHFVSCVLTGAKPLVGGEDGVASLRMAEAIIEACQAVVDQ